MYQKYREQRESLKSDSAPLDDYMGPVTIYVDPLSQPSRAIIFFCRHAKVDHKDHRLALMKGEHKTEEYAKINPKQQVPCIGDGEFLLSECTAILRYIATTRNVDDHWYPKDFRKRARVDEYLSWQPTELRAAGSGMFITAGFPSFMGKEVDEEAMKEKRAKMEKAAADFEKCYLLGDKPFIGGMDEITIADIWAACETVQPLSVGWKFEGHPKMEAWFERVKATFSDWDELNQCVYDVGGKYTPPQ